MLTEHLKQPAEKEYITINFTDRLDAGETISSATVTAILLSDSSSSTATVITGSGVVDTRVYFYVQAGTAGQKHQVTVLAATSNAQVLEEDLPLTIKSQ